MTPFWKSLAHRALKRLITVIFIRKISVASLDILSSVKKKLMFFKTLYVYQEQTRYCTDSDKCPHRKNYVNSTFFFSPFLFIYLFFKFNFDWSKQQAGTTFLYHSEPIIHGIQSTVFWVHFIWELMSLNTRYMLINLCLSWALCHV